MNKLISDISLLIIDNTNKRYLQRLTDNNTEEENKRLYIEVFDEVCNEARKMLNN